MGDAEPGTAASGHLAQVASTEADHSFERVHEARDGA